MSNSPRTAFGLGVATQTNSGQILECYFHNLGLGSAPSSITDGELSLLLGDDSIRKIKRIGVKIQINLDDKPKDVSDVYLRLHLLSHRIVKPNSLNLEGIFGILPNVVWTSAGACAVDGFEKVRHELQNKYGNMIVYGVDKFPRMVDYVIPEGVRIADGDRVRLGAYLSAGTTVMHEGFINFNAGTLGKSMVEGRISAGVVVGDGSDIGGGASIMGTLSGGGKEVISVGQRTLLGANSGIGISLGDDCIVEAGIYITAGSKISLPDGKIVKAKELSGANNLLFRRNSQSGSLEVLPKTGTWSGLNSVLHNN
jgi:2,3,4,5-tetrahydropyridine-2-carboxylate N-succinyltransferase